MPCNVDAVTSPRDTREPLSLSLHYIGSFLRFHSQVEHNASLFQYVLFRRTLQNYTKLFNSRTSDCENHIKCDGFVHYQAFGTQFRLRNLTNRAEDREFRLRNSVSIGGLCTSQRAPCTSEWWSIYPTESIMCVGKAVDIPL